MVRCVVDIARVVAQRAAEQREAVGPLAAAAAARAQQRAHVVVARELRRAVCAARALVVLPSGFCVIHVLMSFHFLQV